MEQNMTGHDSNPGQSGVAQEEPFFSEDPETMREYPLIEVLTQLTRRKWIIANVTGISLFVGLILCFTLPTHYTSCTTIMPPKQSQSTTSMLNPQLGMGGLMEAAGGGLLKDPNAIYIGLLKSRPIADAIIDRFGLTKVYHARDMMAARAKLKKNTQIVSESSTLISIFVLDGDRKRAADIANAYTDQLRVLTKSISITEASKRRLFFEEQLKSQKEALIAAEVAFQQVQQSKGLVHLDAQATVIIGGLATLRGQIAAKKVELQALRTYSTEHNPEVQLAERELSAMQEEAARMEEHSQPAGSSDMGLKDISKVGLDYVRAAREMQYQQALFEMLMKQYEVAKLDEAKDATVIQVVEPAIEADRRSDPKRLVIMFASAFLGLFFGLLAAILQNWVERGLAAPDGSEVFRRLRSALTGEVRSDGRTAT
jgi:uncharacterized protein involved in exopolysaccharide biosynthesis